MDKDKELIYERNITLYYPFELFIMIENERCFIDFMSERKQLYTMWKFRERVLCVCVSAGVEIGDFMPVSDCIQSIQILFQSRFDTCDLKTALCYPRDVDLIYQGR